MIKKDKRQKETRLHPYTGGSKVYPTYGKMEGK